MHSNEKTKVVPVGHSAILRWPRVGRLWEKLIQENILRKSQALIVKIEPYIQKLKQSGMWLSDDIQHRILFLAGE